MDYKSYGFNYGNNINFAKLSIYFIKLLLFTYLAINVPQPNKRFGLSVCTYSTY